MSRLLAVVLLASWPTLLRAQNAEPPLVEQFDGKTLQGWEIDGESVIENGLLKIGGKAEAKLRLTTPLGDQFKVHLEFKYTGPAPLFLYYQAGGPFQKMELSWDADDWSEYKIKRTRGNLGFGYLFDFTHQSKSGSGAGGLPYGDGDFREFSLIVAPGRTLTIRRIAAATSPPASPSGFPWTSLAVVGLALVGVIISGWYANRRRPSGPATPSVPDGKVTP